MSRVRNGVTNQLRNKQSKALFTHCYGCTLNLAASDIIQKCCTMKKALETAHEITKLVKYISTLQKGEACFKHQRGFDT